MTKMVLILVDELNNVSVATLSPEGEEFIKNEPGAGNKYWEWKPELPDETQMLLQEVVSQFTEGEKNAL